MGSNSEKLISKVAASDPLRLIGCAVVETYKLITTPGRPALRDAKMSLLTAVNTGSTTGKKGVFRKLLHTGSACWAQAEQRSKVITSSPEKAMERLTSKRATKITEDWRGKIVDFFSREEISR